uniref:Transmembrane protein 79 n=1 Tax=Sphenodon punctatus TaxID=8508 RepID=A0A8D0G8G3_SPHPU
MAMVDPVEELALVEMKKESLGTKVAPDSVQDEKPGNPETTQPWDQSHHSSLCEIEMEAPSLESSKNDTRLHPEGNPELGSILHDEALPDHPTPREDEDNGMPEVAAHVFVPIDPCCIERTPGRIVCCEENRDPEKQDFLNPGPHGYSAHYDEPTGYDGDRPKTFSEKMACLKCRDCSSTNLKAVASMIGAMIIYPCLVYGAYVFLPFDAPLLPTMSARLVYTLRCGVFATFPIIMGMIVYGVSCLCFSSLQPFGELRREVEIHRCYVSQSVHLFILYFFNIAVLSTYLPQETLKLIPLLTGLFAISRLLYWLAYAMGRSFRGFGFGLTFLPLLTMLLWNLYSMFILEPENMFATANGAAEGPSEKESRAAKPRYWG